MALSPLAGKPRRFDAGQRPAPGHRLLRGAPGSRRTAQRVAFGTSGHRGSAFRRSFNEAHILAITQAICDYRKQAGIDGPLFLGMDTHALSEPAFATRARGAGGQRRRGHDRPRPRLHADAGDLARDPHLQPRPRRPRLADGIVITPSHNPPEDGGFKYNPPHGGPADTQVTSGSRTAPTRCSPTACASSPRAPFQKALARGDHASPRLRRRVRRRSRRASSTWRSIRARALQARRRSARRRRRGATGTPIAERYGLDMDDRERDPSIRRSAS